MNLWQRLRALVTRAQPGEERVYVPIRQAGVNVTEDSALTLADWWACVSVMSRTVAALPWHVYERTSEGRRALDNQIGWLLNNAPNEEMTAFSFREALMAHVLNWGNAYAEIVRDMARRPSSLWLITPDRVTPKRDAATGVLQYRVRTPGAADAVIPAGDMLHLHGLGFDGLTGYSPVRMAARTVGIGIAQDTFAQAFYANGTQFGSIVELPATMNAQQIADAEAHLNAKHGGPDKAFRVKVAPANTKVHPTGMPLNDAQFIESRGFTVTACARWLGVPPHKIADLTRSTNNNIEHQSIEFVTDAIVPWARRLEQEADIKLIGGRSQGRVYTKLAVNALMRGDSKSRAEFYRTMVSIGVMSVNEVRELEELNGIGPAGDAHLVQVNQTTLERLVEGPHEDETDAAAAAADAADAAEADDGADDGADGENGADGDGETTRDVIRREARAFWQQQARQA